MSAGGSITVITEVLQCECNPGKTYISRSTFSQHRKSKRHIAWQTRNAERDSVSRVVERDVEIAKLKKRIRELEDYIRSSGTKRKLSETAKKKTAASQEWKCGMCRNMLTHVFEVDHVVPLYMGGGNDDSNLMALCRECHGIKTAEDRQSSRSDEVQILNDS